MDNKPTAQLSTGRGVERMPGGQPLALTDRERARIEPTACPRDQNLADAEREHRGP